MTMETWLDVREMLEERKSAVAVAWLDALDRTSFIAVDSVSLSHHLTGLADRAVTALLTDPFPRHDAVSVGIELGRLRHSQPAVIGDILDVLVGELSLILTPPERGGLWPSFAALLSAIAAGFTEGQRATVLADQEAVHRAAFEARLQAEEALRASEDRYRAVVTQAAEGIVLTDAGTCRVVETNLAFQQMLGYTAEELVGLPLYRIVAHRRDSVRANIEQTLKEGRRHLQERHCRRRDGTLLTVESSITTVKTKRGTLLCAVVRDITERQQFEAALRAARAALAESREAERLRLAQDLHDSVVQELLGLRYQLVAASEQWAAGGEECDLLSTAERVDRGLVKVVGELRELIGELRPPGIDAGGLRGALENWLQGFPHDRSPHISLDVGEETRELPKAIVLCLFRVAQEAVRNAVEHAEAEWVVVRIRPRPNQVILTVCDDGRGFDVPEHLDSFVQQGHFGLSGMAERVSRASGKLRIRSRSGRGTTVAAWLPLIRSEQSEGVLSGRHSSAHR